MPLRRIALIAVALVLAAAAAVVAIGALVADHPARVQGPPADTRAVDISRVVRMSMKSAEAEARSSTDATGLSVPTPPRRGAVRLNVISVTPESEGPFGVGITIRIGFDQDVPEAARAAIEQRARVVADRPLGPAAWSWIDPRTMVFRPREFWPADTTVSLDTTWNRGVLAALPALQGRARFLVTDDSPELEFRVGRDQVLTIRAGTQMGTLTRDGVEIRQVPVSMGKPGWETRSGVKTIMERYRVTRMTNVEVGDFTETYDLEVPFAMRLTPSGEFLHAAPWAEGRLGVYAGSHGCTNLSMADGEWFFENALEGDPVVTIGTGRPMEATNGPGGAWNLTWPEWLAASGAGEAQRTSAADEITR